MKRSLNSFVVRPLLPMLLVAGLALPQFVQATSVALATSPLATSTTTTVKPNLLFVLDNSGSMDWDHMPDDASDGGSAVSFVYGYYGLRSSQCNQVYYDPTNTYLPPVYSNGTSYPDATFTGAWTNGYNTGSGTVNLNTSFQASQSLSGDGAGQTAYYYSYSGAQLTAAQRNYNSTTNTFYQECNSAQHAAPGRNVFTRIVLSNSAAATTATIVAGCSGCSNTTVSGIKINGTQEIMSAATPTSTTVTTTVASEIAAKINLCTSAKVGNCTTTGGHGYTATVTGSTVAITGLAATATSLIVTQSGTMTLDRTIFPIADTARLTNFANWYSYYRNRLLMMKTASGRAFSSLNNSYRVGMMKISQTNPVVNMGTFETTQRDTWYSTLYGMTTSGSTPTRRALSDAGRYFAGKLSSEPLQYSCQQNFTILATDGYWNTGDGYQVDGSTLVGNQDGTADRPMFDGSQSGTTVTITYTRNNYSKISSGCSGSQKRLQTQPQIGSCAVTVVTVTGSETCTPGTWSNNGAATYGSCASSGSITLPSPNPSNKVESARVTTSGSVGGTSDNLADIAMYYYQTDLRTPTLSNCGTAVAPATVGPLCENNVFRTGTDSNLQQHMTTFTLGLGASGWMTYSPSYLTDTSGDYVSVKLGSTASASVCTWQGAGTVCNWPVPGMAGSDGYIANVDDLWHAAINGRGAYFSATNPASLSAGLSNALSGINARKGAAAAAATSTLNPVAGNNYAYVASYTTVAWKGNMEARGINVDIGAVNENAAWCVENVVAGSCPAPGTVVADTSGATTAYNCVTPNSVTCTGGTLVGTDCKVPVATACTGTMNTKVSDVTDTRAIYTANSAGTALTAFDSAYATANPTNFAAAHISGLSQWTSLTAAQQSAAAGTNLVNYLRGQHGYEDRTVNPVANRLYRYREAVLGDALESQPAFIGDPVFSYPYAGYSAFKTAQTGRAGTVYMGANDGMMHAFAGDTGIERWAYVPSMVISNMWKLADKNYSTGHVNFVNGSPTTSDIYCPGNCGGVTDVTYGDSASWRTILVAGLNGGGRGYYALDITVPTAPTLLWEITPTTGSGKVKDDDIGYGFGMPTIARKADGTWVVLLTSGYNNISPGTGKGYLFVLDASTGAIISKIDTGVGNTTTPSGLAKIAGWNDEPGGSLVGYVYGGDLLGNVWRFNVNSTVAATIGTGDVMKFAALYADAGGTSPQPITTMPVLGSIVGKRVVFIGTGKYLETGDLTTTQVQSIYAIKDDNATATLVNPRNTLVHQYLINNPNGTATRLSSGTSTTTAASTINTVNFYTGRGWYVDLPDTGERVNLDAQLVQGTLLVPSIVPSNTACTPGGYGWLNYLNYKTGGAVNVSTNLSAIRSDAPLVGVNVIFVQGNPMALAVDAYNPTPQNPGGDLFGTSAAGFAGKRVIWRELIP